MNMWERLRTKEAKLMLIIALIYLLSLGGIVAKQPVEASERGTIFTDIKSGSEYEEALASLVQQKIIFGYSDGTYRASEKLSREQTAVILARALQLNLDVVDDPDFQDVNESSEYYKSIAAVVSAGIFQGYSDGTFKPDQSLTRAEMAKILVVAYQLLEEELAVNPFKDVSSTSWYAPYLTSLIQNKITVGTSLTTYSPNNAVTRGEMALFIYRCQQLAQQLTEGIIESEVTAITSDSVQLRNKSFALTDDQKTWITPGNLPILKNARIKAQIIGGKISRIESITLYANGLLNAEKKNPNVVLIGNGAVIDATVIIKGDHLSIKDATITEDLIIESDVQNSFYLENVLVKGSTILSKPRGIVTAETYNTFVPLDNKNSRNPKLHFHNSILQSVKAALESFTIKLTGETKVNEIDLLVDARIEADASITIPIVRVGSGSLNIDLNAVIDSLFIENANSRVTLDNNAKIEDLRLELKHNVKLIFLNYELIKHKIIRINGFPNIDVQPPTGGGGVDYGSPDSGENSKLIAAKNAVASLFTDSTKTALKAGVDQAAIDAAKEKVDLVDEGAEKSALKKAIEIAQDLLSQILAAPTLTGTAPNVDTVRITFSDDAAWRNKISGVYLNGNSVPIHSSRVNRSTAGVIEINLTGASLRPGTHEFLIKADGYADAVVTLVVDPPLAVPTLTAAAPNVDTVRITFSDDAAWRNKISGVYLNGNSIPIHDSRVNKSAAGVIVINLNGASLKPGTHEFLIKAEGYADAVVTLVVDPPLAAPTLTGTTPNVDTVRITFSDDAAWRNKISGVYLNGNSVPIHSSRVNRSTAGVIEINLTGASLRPGTHEFLIKADGYADAVVTLMVDPPLPAPTLTATAPNVDTVRITFSDDAAWRNKITGIYLNGNSIPIHSSRVNTSNEGMIEIDLTGASLKPGTHEFLIKADGYEDVMVAIIIES